MNICYLDVETGGLDPLINPTLQIGAILVSLGKEVGRVNVKLKPFIDQVLDDKALACNGFTREEIEGFPDPGGAVCELTNALAGPDWFLCGYNVGFDEGFIRELFRRTGRKYTDYFRQPHLDVMTLAGFVLRDECFKLNNFKLSTVAKYCGVAVDETKLHDAMFDIKITRELMRVLFSLMKKE